MPRGSLRWGSEVWRRTVYREGPIPILCDRDAGGRWQCHRHVPLRFTGIVRLLATRIGVDQHQLSYLNPVAITDIGSAHIVSVHGRHALPSGLQDDSDPFASKCEMMRHDT